MIQQSKFRSFHCSFPLIASRFIESEADLDAAIKALLPLSQAPSLGYAEMVRSGTVELLVGLLSHENMDIVIDVVELIHELTDEDVGNEGENGEEEEERNTEALKILIEAFVSRTYDPHRTQDLSVETFNIGALGG